jgi:hypothetical protein
VCHLAAPESAPFAIPAQTRATRLVTAATSRWARCPAGAVLTGLRPSPTSHAFGFRFSGKLAQGPAVRATDRRHSLRLDMLTSTRSAYVQVRCAVVALWSERIPRYAHRIRPASTKLDSIKPTSSDLAWLGHDRRVSVPPVSEDHPPGKLAWTVDTRQHGGEEDRQTIDCLQDASTAVTRSR